MMNNKEVENNKSNTLLSERNEVVKSNQLVVCRAHVDFSEAVKVRQVEVDLKRPPMPGPVLLSRVPRTC